MGRKEKQIINKVLLDGSKKGRLFRANSGSGWTGEIGSIRPGKLLLINPRKFHGMPTGTPDLIGWEQMRICDIIDWKNPGVKRVCPDKNIICDTCHLNKKIAIFKGVEVKTGKQKLTPEQENFKRILLEHGGIYEERRE